MSCTRLSTYLLTGSLNDSFVYSSTLSFTQPVIPSLMVQLQTLLQVWIVLQDRQCTYNVMLRRVRVTIVAVEEL